MEKIKLLLADTNEAYVRPLESKLVEILGDIAEIHIITDVAFFTEYFSEAQKIDIAIFDEKLYDNALNKHSFDEIYILRENIAEDGRTEQLKINHISRYSSVKEIISRIMRGNVVSKKMNYKAEKTTKLIMTYSPIGGAGTSTLAMSIAAIAAKGLRKVLYVAVDNLQNFQWLMKNKPVFPSALESKLSEISEFSYGEIKMAIANEGFDYLPAFRQAMSVLDVKVANMVELIQKIKETTEYEYIVVDTSSDFNESLPKLMGIADKVVVVTKQDKVSAKKLERLLLNIDTSNGNKFSIVCNKYMPDKENFIIDENLVDKCHVAQYVNNIEEIKEQPVEICVQNTQIQQFAYLYI